MTQPTERPHNFSAGPAILPFEVLERAQRELLDTAGTGLSVMEWSHRSPEYGEVHEGAERLLRELIGPSAEGYRFLFLQGGASLQFLQVPLNLAAVDWPGGYVSTGVWSKKALAEAERVGRGRLLWSGEEDRFSALPRPGSWSVDADAAYCHITTNNTVAGTEWSSLPDVGDVPLVADMSSNILSEPLDLSLFGLVYAGAQKNLGPAGLALVIVREDLLERAGEDVPNILNYRKHDEADGLYHTPPTFAVWLMKCVFEWIRDQGGLEALGRVNGEKARLLYDVIDGSGFWNGTAEPESRSRMNVTFRTADQALEPAFLAEAHEAGFVGLKGHRLVGGIRASLYNAMPRASVEALVEFMRAFEARHG